MWAAALLLLPFNRRPKGAVYAPMLSYWKPSISNSIGPALGSEALKNISYPAQVCPAHPLFSWCTQAHGNGGVPPLDGEQSLPLYTA